MPELKAGATTRDELLLQSECWADRKYFRKKKIYG